MSTHRGTASIQRRKAKNFITAEAQKRIDELMPQIQDQGINALKVDAHHVLYFSKIKGGNTCSCKIIDTKIELEDGSTTEAKPAFTNFDTSKNETIKIDFNRPLFGQHNEVATSEDDDEDLTDFLLEEKTDVTGNSNYQEHLFSNSAECSICYRTGYVPGFKVLHHDRRVFTHYDILNLEGFNLERARPHKLTSLHSESFVEFETTIPKYFKSVKFSVKDNTTKIYATLSINGQPLSLSQLRLNAGKKVVLRIEGLDVDKSFTHITLDFALDVDPLTANISQLSKNLDYTMYDTTGSITVYFPMTHEKCESGDLIYVPEKKIMLKVTDVTYSQTAANKRFEWQCTTRVVQPQELVQSLVLDTVLT